MQRQLPSSSATVVLTEDVAPPTLPMYPTVPIDQVPYLEGFSPADPEAREYQWDSISDTFLLTTKGRRIILDRNDFIRRYYPPDQAEQIIDSIDACIIDEAEQRRRMRLLAPIPIQETNRPAEGNYLVQVYFDVPQVEGASPYVTFPAQSAAINRENIVAWLHDLYERGQLLVDPRSDQVRIDIIHPLMFDWSTGHPTPGAQEIPVGSAEQQHFELETDALDHFAGLKSRLEEEHLPLNSVVVPIVIRSRREQPMRAARLAPETSAAEEAEQLYPDDPYQRRKYILEQLAQRYSKATVRARDIELFREISRMIREGDTQRPRELLPHLLLPEEDAQEVGARRRADDPERLAARQFLLDLIEALRGIYDGTRDPSDEETLLRSLVESLLSVDLDAPLDYANEPNYWREWKYILRDLSERAYGTGFSRAAKESAQKTLLFMVDALEDIVDDARERWAYIYSANDLWPILDRDTGLIVGYKNKEPGTIDWDETPLAVEAQMTNMEPSTLGAPMPHVVTCHKCKHGRAAASHQPLPTTHVTFVAAAAAGPGQQQRGQEQDEDCAQFGFVWRDDKTQEQTRVLWDADTMYVQSVIPKTGTQIAVFARRVQQDPRDPSKLVVETYNPAIGTITLPEAGTRAAWIGNVDRDNGAVTLRDKFDQSIPLRGGVAIEFFCITPDGRTLQFPVRNLIRRRALAYSCGDTALSLPPRFAAVAHRLQALRKMQREGTFPPGSASRRRLDEQIARLENVLHNAPQESEQEMAHRLSKTFAVHENDEWLKLIDQIDARAIQKWRDRTEYGLVAPEAGAEEYEEEPPVSPLSHPPISASSSPEAEREITPPAKRPKLTRAQRDRQEAALETAAVERARRGLPSDEELVARGLTVQEMVALGIPQARARRLYGRVLQQDVNLAEATDVGAGDFIGGPTADVQDRMDDIRDGILTQQMMRGQYSERLEHTVDEYERARLRAQIDRIDDNIQNSVALLDELQVRAEQDPLQGFKGPRRSIYARLLEIMEHSPQYARGVHYAELYQPLVDMLRSQHEPVPQNEKERERLLKTINSVLNPGKRQSIPRIFVLQERDVKQGLEPLGLFILRSNVRPDNMNGIVQFATSWARQHNKHLDTARLQLRLWQDYLLRLYQEQEEATADAINRWTATVQQLQQQYPQAPVMQALQNVRPEVEEAELSKMTAAERRRKRKRGDGGSGMTPAQQQSPFAAATTAVVPAVTQSTEGNSDNHRRRAALRTRPLLHASSGTFQTWADVVGDDDDADGGSNSSQQRKYNNSNIAPVTTLLGAARESLAAAIREFPSADAQQGTPEDVAQSFLSQPRVQTLIRDTLDRDDATHAVMILNDFTRRVEALARALASSSRNARYQVPLLQTLDVLWQAAVAAAATPTHDLARHMSQSLHL